MLTPQVIGEFARVVEAASALSLDEQETLIEILLRRMGDWKREALAGRIQCARDEAAQGLGRPASVEAIMKEAVE